MSNIDRWNEWMKERGISQTALAEMLHCSRGTVNRILTRARKPSPLVARRMEELMEESEKSITAVVPDEMETQLREWAAEAHESIEQLLDRLIANLPKRRDE
ncbi:MAG: helix-turn-helix transcriptional regulator [Akkermansia sp.]|nr:helix-turn-helix transcriptional regulator [Akkermansia sp.]